MAAVQGQLLTPSSPLKCSLGPLGYDRPATNVRSRRYVLPRLCSVCERGCTYIAPCVIGERDVYAEHDAEHVYIARDPTSREHKDAGSHLEASYIGSRQVVFISSYCVKGLWYLRYSKKRVRCAHQATGADHNEVVCGTIQRTLSGHHPQRKHSCTVAYGFANVYAVVLLAVSTLYCQQAHVDGTMMGLLQHTAAVVSAVQL